MNKTSPNPKTKAVKLPKARVMHANFFDLCTHRGTPESPLECVDKKSSYGHRYPVAVLPCASAKAAKLMVKTYNSGLEEMVDKMAFSFFPIEWELKEKHPKAYAIEWEDCRCKCRMFLVDELGLAPAKPEDKSHA